MTALAILDDMQQKNILIVDDSGSMRKVLEDMLKEGGYTNVKTSSGGKEAIEVCEREHPDLVLLDIIMPEVNGMDVLRALSGKMKFLVISAVGQDAVVSEAKALGALDYIVKPLERSQVLSAVSRIIGAAN